MLPGATGWPRRSQVARGPWTRFGTRQPQRALLPGAVSTASLSEPQKPAPIAPADSPGEAADLLDDFLIALLDLPGWSDPGSWLWNDVAAVLPDELFDRIDRWMEVRFAPI